MILALMKGVRFYYCHTLVHKVQNPSEETEVQEPNHKGQG
jgi:hypothetical protein